MKLYKIDQKNYFRALKIDQRHNNLRGMYAWKIRSFREEPWESGVLLFLAAPRDTPWTPAASPSQLGKCRILPASLLQLTGIHPVWRAEWWLCPSVLSREVMIPEAQLGAKTNTRQGRHSTWAQNLRRHQKNRITEDKRYFSAIFLKMKLMQKIRDEQNIKNLNKNESQPWQWSYWSCVYCSIFLAEGSYQRKMYIVFVCISI